MAVLGLGIEDAKKAAGTIANVITGGALQRNADKRQLRQQKKLMKLETANNKALANYNHGLALDMWDKTNYSAQRQQMEKAGINPGLMYGSAGSGGTTSGAGSAGMVDAGKAEPQSMGMGMQLGMQMQLMKAQKENIEADTANKQANTTKTGGVDTEETKGKIGKLAAETTNEALKGTLLKLDEKIKTVESNIAEKTEAFAIQEIWSSTEAAVAEARRNTAESKVAEGTANTQIEQIKRASIEQMLRIAGQKAGLNKTEVEIAKMAAEIINAKNVTELNTSSAEWAGQWTRIGTDIVRAITGAVK